MNTSRCITKAQKAQWIEALRSGKYPKGESALFNYGNEKQVTGYCCLGVYCAAVIGENPLAFFGDGDELGKVNVLTEDNYPIILSKDIPLEFREKLYEAYVTECNLIGESPGDKDILMSYGIENMLAELNDKSSNFEGVIRLIENFVPTRD